MKKITIFLFTLFLVLSLSSCMTFRILSFKGHTIKPAEADLKGTPQDSIVLYGYSKGQRDSITMVQVDSTKKPNSFFLTPGTWYSQPLEPGATYKLVQWKWTESNAYAETTYINQFRLNELHGFVLTLPKEPGLYYCDLFENRPAKNGKRIKGEEIKISAIKSKFANDTDRMNKELAKIETKYKKDENKKRTMVLKTSLIPYYKNTAWLPLIESEIEKLKEELKNGK